MGLESGTLVEDLNPAWPLGTDPKEQGDDHIRLLKFVLQNMNSVTGDDITNRVDNKWLTPATIDAILALVNAVAPDSTAELSVGYTLDEAPTVADDTLTPDFAIKMMQQWTPTAAGTINEPAAIGAADYLVIPGGDFTVSLGSVNMKWVANSVKDLVSGTEYLMRVTRWSATRTTVSIVEVEA